MNAVKPVGKVLNKGLHGVNKGLHGAKPGIESGLNGDKHGIGSGLNGLKRVGSGILQQGSEHGGLGDNQRSGSKKNASFAVADQEADKSDINLMNSDSFDTNFDDADMELPITEAPKTRSKPKKLDRIWSVAAFDEAVDDSSDDDFMPPDTRPSSAMASIMSSAKVASKTKNGGPLLSNNLKKNAEKTLDTADESGASKSSGKTKKKKSKSMNLSDSVSVFRSSSKNPKTKRRNSVGGLADKKKALREDKDKDKDKESNGYSSDGGLATKKRELRKKKSKGDVKQDETTDDGSVKSPVSRKLAKRRSSKNGGSTSASPKARRKSKKGMPADETVPSTPPASPHTPGAKIKFVERDSVTSSSTHSRKSTTSRSPKTKRRNSVGTLAEKKKSLKGKKSNPDSNIFAEGLWASSNAGEKEKLPQEKETTTQTKPTFPMKLPFDQRTTSDTHEEPKKKNPSLVLQVKKLATATTSTSGNPWLTLKNRIQQAKKEQSSSSSSTAPEIAPMSPKPAPRKNPLLAVMTRHSQGPPPSPGSPKKMTGKMMMPGNTGNDQVAPLATTKSLNPNNNTNTPASPQPEVANNDNISEDGKQFDEQAAPDPVAGGGAEFALRNVRRFTNTGSKWDAMRAGAHFIENTKKSASFANLWTDEAAEATNNNSGVTGSASLVLAAQPKAPARVEEDEEDMYVEGGDSDSTPMIPQRPRSMAAMMSDDAADERLAEVETLEKGLTKERESLRKERESIAFERESLELQLDEEAQRNESLNQKNKDLEQKLQEQKFTGAAVDAHEVTELSGDNEALRAQLKREEQEAWQRLIEKESEITELKQTIKDLNIDDNVEDFSVNPTGGKSRQRLQGELLQAAAKLSDRDAIIASQHKEMAAMSKELDSLRTGQGVQKLKTEMEKIRKEKDELAAALAKERKETEKKVTSKDETIAFLIEELGKMKNQSSPAEGFGMMSLNDESAKKDPLDNSQHSVGSMLRFAGFGTSSGGLRDRPRRFRSTSEISSPNL